MNEIIYSGCEVVSNRWLQQDNETTGNATQTTTNNDATVLRATFVVYGSLLLAMFLTFCYVRRKFPRPYQLRKWVAKIKVRVDCISSYYLYFFASMFIDAVFVLIVCLVVDMF
jgi:hypothetical protein